MNMKDMIQRMTDLENEAKQTLTESEQLGECPPDMAEAPGMAPAPMDQGNPVTMNISMNASGKDHVADLIGMMKNAGLGDAAPAADAMMPVRQDMERLSAMMDEPGDEDTDEAYSPGDENEEGMVSNCCGAPIMDVYQGHGRCSDCKEMASAVAEESVEEWANSPEGHEGEPEYADHELMIKDLSGGINREKKQYAKAQDGDNAMAVEAIKAQLMAALSEKKKPDADGDGVPDWADKKPGKDDNAGKKKGSKPKKGEVPPQFKKK